MSQDVDQVFIDMFERELHHAYGRNGSKLAPTVRQGAGGVGSQVYFPLMGKTVSISKARHSEVPIADRGEDRVLCSITDDYTPADMIDDLDQLKTNIALRQGYTYDHASALGRRSDQKIIDALDESTNETSGTGVIDIDKINEVFTYFGDNAVPSDDRRYGAVSAKGWTDLMAIPQFSSADYVPQGELPFAGGSGTAKRWFTFMWFVQEGGYTNGIADQGGLPKATNTRSSICYHWRGVGYHNQKSPSTKVAWENLRQAWSIVSSAASGACMIDETAIYKILHDETATPA